MGPSPNTASRLTRISVPRPSECSRPLSELAEPIGFGIGVVGLGTYRDLQKLQVTNTPPFSSGVQIGEVRAADVLPAGCGDRAEPSEVAQVGLDVRALRDQLLLAHAQQLCDREGRPVYSGQLVALELDLIRRSQRLPTADRPIHFDLEVGEVVQPRLCQLRISAWAQLDGDIALAVLLDPS